MSVWGTLARSATRRAVLGVTATVEWKAQRIDNIAVSQEHLQPIRFQGQHFDEEIGLNYNRFRYFDPDLGMFTTRDPIGLMGGTNVFQYAPNPVGWIDPFGLSGCNSVERLPDDMAGTFAGGRYSSRVLDEDIILHRAGVEGKPLGQYFSRDKPISEIQTRIDKAVLPRWPDGGQSPMDTAFTIKIPKGTTVHTGQVGSQNDFYVGGTQQIVVQKPWLIDGVEVLSSSPLK